MVFGCSGIINDRVYAVTPSSNSYTLDATLLNGNILVNGTGCPLVRLTYAACTVISNPPTIVFVGTDSRGMAGAQLLQFSSDGLCQLSEKGYSIGGMGQPVSVVPSSCDSPTPSIPCFAVLGFSATTHQYIIQYPTSLSFNSSNPITIGLGEPDIHPVLALSPQDTSKMYVIGYPTKDQILLLSNGGSHSSSTITSSASPALFTTTTSTLPEPTLIIVTSRPSNRNVAIFGRAEPTHGLDTANLEAGSYIKLDAAIENTGPAATVGNNIVIVSNSSLIAEMIAVPPSAAPQPLPVTKFNIPPSSQLQNANSLIGIDSLTPLPVQKGDSSTIWINYDDGHGHHIQVSSQQPGLFISPTTTGSGTPGGETHFEATSAASSLSAGAIAGIVVGSIVGFLLLGLLCFFLWRRQRLTHRQHQSMAGGNNRNISLTDQRFLTEKTASTPTTYISTPNKDDSTSVIITSRSHIRPDDTMDDTPPLNSLTRHINTESAPHNDTYYEPTSTNETLAFGSPSVYYLHNEPPIYAPFPQGYATRSATHTRNGQLSTECTIHYFPASSTPWIRHLLYTNKGLQDHRHAVATEEQETTMTAGLQSYDAIQLSQPTPHGHYQYIWITSPFQLQHTLHALLFEGGHTVVDSHQFSFKAWSTLSMLKSLDDFHQSGWLHRKLNASCFFYDQASSVTDWRLAGFYQSIWYTGLADKVMELQWDECSAPECWDISSHAPMVSVPSMDIWSLGCVLYSVATGKRAFQHVNEYHAILQSGQLQVKVNAMVDEAALVDDSYRQLLSRMLQINPGARDSLPNLVNYWIQANQLNDDE